MRSGSATYRDKHGRTDLVGARGFAAGLSVAHQQNLHSQRGSCRTFMMGGARA